MKAFQLLSLSLSLSFRLSQRHKDPHISLTFTHSLSLFLSLSQDRSHCPSLAPMADVIKHFWRNVDFYRKFRNSRRVCSNAITYLMQYTKWLDKAVFIKKVYSKIIYILLLELLIYVISAQDQIQIFEISSKNSFITLSLLLLHTQTHNHHSHAIKQCDEKKIAKRL